MKKNTLLLFFAFFLQHVLIAQTKATPPYEPEQYIRSILQEINIPDATFEKMRGKDNIVPLKIFLSDKGVPVKVSITNDELELTPVIFEAVKQLPNFTPAIVDGVAKNSLYQITFAINEFNYYKLVRQKAIPTVGMEKFSKKVANNFYLTAEERAKLSTAKLKGSYELKIDFIIEKDGKPTSFQLHDQDMEYFKDRMVQAIKRASKTWLPGTLNGLPVRTKFTYTLTINADFHSLNI